MSHEEIQEKLWALYDGQLAEEEKEPLETHLRDCPECRGLLSEWKNVSGMLFQKPELSGADAELFTQEVMARVRGPVETPVVSWKRAALPWLAPVLASALAAAWVFFFLLPGTPGLTTGPAQEDFLSEEAASPPSPASGIVPVSWTTDDLVQDLVRE